MPYLWLALNSETMSYLCLAVLTQQVSAGGAVVDGGGPGQLVAHGTLQRLQSRSFAGLLPFACGVRLLPLQT